MKPIGLLAFMLVAVTSVNAVFGETRRRTVQEQIRYCDVVAEVRIERIYLGRAPKDKFDDLFCECTVLQGFKMPVATNRLILRLNFAAQPRSDYEKKTAMLFAFEHERGGFTPWGAKQGLILTNQTYSEYNSVDSKKYVRKEFKYDELLREISRITESNKHGTVDEKVKEKVPAKSKDARAAYPALQRPRRARRGCNRCVPCAGSLGH